MDPIRSTSFKLLIPGPYTNLRSAVQRRESRKSRIVPGTSHKRESGDITQEQFDRLLTWLDPDREAAGTKYEWLRKRLIKIFASRGSHIPEDLADRTMNRVAWKLPEIQAAYVGYPAPYFLSVARYIFCESLREERSSVIRMPELVPPNGDVERDLEILQECVEKLPPADRVLLLSYYEQDGQGKIDHRKQMAEQLGVCMNALRIRICRIRLRLQEDMERSRLRTQIS